MSTSPKDLEPNPDDPERGGRRGGGRAPRNPERLAAVSRLLKLCYANDEIERHFSAKWNVSRQTVRNYIREVFDEWRDNSPSDPDERKRSAEALSVLYKEAVKRGEIKAGTRALEVRARLLGLFVEKHEITGPGGAAIEISLGDAREQLASKLIKKVGAPSLDKSDPDPES